MLLINDKNEVPFEIALFHPEVSPVKSVYVK